MGDRNHLTIVALGAGTGMAVGARLLDMRRMQSRPTRKVVGGPRLLAAAIVPAGVAVAWLLSSRRGSEQSGADSGVADGEFEVAEGAGGTSNNPDTLSR